MKYKFAATALVVLASLSAPMPAFSESKELYLYNWNNYTPPELLKRFTAETGITVKLDTYDTNSTLIAKLQAGGTGYDLVVPSGSAVPRMIRAGLIQKIDASKLPNFSKVRKPFDNPQFDPNRQYTVPYMWGVTAIAYDPQKVKGEKLEESWKELFEPRPEYAGKVGVLKDADEVISIAASYLGFDVCTTKQDEGKKILALLEAQKPSVKVYSSEGTIDRMANGEITLQYMYNGSYHRAHAKNPNLAYLLPKEGVPLWGDSFAIPTGAKNVENAKIFLNWMMDPKNAAEASNFTGFNNAIAGSDEFLLPDMKNDPAINIPEEYSDRFRDALECPKEANDLRQKIWTRLLR